MASRRRKDRSIHQPFEGANPRGQFTKITFDMMQSKAWKDLSLRQRGLYLQLKSKYREKKLDDVVVESNRDDISLPEAEWRGLYGNYNTFKKDMDALRQHGFIKIVARAKYMGKPNIYGFDDAWITDGTKQNA